jgi:hypothetical protein
MDPHTLPESPRWVSLDEGVAYDASSVRVNSTLRRVWARIELRSPNRTPQSIDRIHVLYEIDCANARFRTLSVEMIASAGTRAGRKDAAGEWTRITPAHATEALLHTRVCAIAR